MTPVNCCICSKELKRREVCNANRIIPKSNHYLCDVCYSKRLILIGDVEAPEDRQKEVFQFFYDKRNSTKDEILLFEINQLLGEENEKSDEEIQEMRALEKKEDNRIFIKPDLLESVREQALNHLDDDLVCKIQGARGRSIRIYPYKVMIRVDATVGSVLTQNVFDGEKTIYFKDCVGIQFKRSGAALGYLQFETASGTMNNEKSNFFNENTFTFEGNNDVMQKVYEYIIGVMDQIKEVY